MPEIKPFYGIRPNADYADEVVLDIENLSLSEAKIIRQENPYSYVNMLVPRLDNLFLRGSKNELAYKKINENFEDFLEKGVFVHDTKPSIYVYRISKLGNIQTGIWTVTSVDDYLNGKIKKHELTRPDRENVLIDYLQQTGIDANPVLITYNAVEEINSIIDETCKESPHLSFSKHESLHQLWKVDDEAVIKALIRSFADLPGAYIADGHHRAAAAALLALRQRELNLNYTGNEEYNFFTSVYMASDQLKVYPFHRLVKDLNGKSTEEFFEELTKYFKIGDSTDIVIPLQLHEFGMYLNGSWYKLIARTETCQSNNSVEGLDVSILQDYVFSRILNISDPRTDPGISYSGGNLPIEVPLKQVDEGLYALMFTLFPASIEQLMKVADEGEVMPPKSTWFEPKFQVGLLVHQIN